ncbi:MAG: AAA family ATPase [Nitrososphaeraceae archaeon]
MEINTIGNMIVDKIFDDIGCELNRDNYIIVGNNMKGKSKLISNIIRNNLKKEIYFIDAVNRSIENHNPMGLFANILSSQEILEERVKKDVFNKKDVITNIYDSKLIFNEMIENGDDYFTMISEILGQEFELKKYETEIFLSSESEESTIESSYKYSIGNEEYVDISSGLQALIRIIIELIYAKKSGVKLVLIEEIENHLDNRNCQKIIKFLVEKFSEMNFIISTHSPDVIIAAENFNIIKIITDNDIYIYDSYDFDDFDYVNRTLFTNLFRINNISDIELGNYIRKLSAGGKLNSSDIEKINGLDNLSVKQNVLKKYILEWSNEDKISDKV